LTPSRQEIDLKFKDWFLKFVEKNPVYLITGSDYPKTIEQLGDQLCYTVERVYNCCGNEVWEKGKNIYSSDWKMGDDQLAWLEKQIKNSPYKNKTGNHIEKRAGMVNFSVVGRNATLQQRKEYFLWDIINEERLTISRKLMKKFPYLTAVLGGETGIDIFPIGKDKSQILNNFIGRDLCFFGDRIDPDGNDYTIANLIERNGGAVYPVKNFQETWKILQTLDN
jgi:phosphomannomutase